MNVAQGDLKVMLSRSPSAARQLRPFQGYLARSALHPPSRLLARVPISHVDAKGKVALDELLAVLSLEAKLREACL